MGLYLGKQIGEKDSDVLQKIRKGTIIRLQIHRNPINHNNLVIKTTLAE